jgi:hypothetical protein
VHESSHQGSNPLLRSSIASARAFPNSSSFLGFDVFAISGKIIVNARTGQPIGCCFEHGRSAGSRSRDRRAPPLVSSPFRIAANSPVAVQAALEVAGTAAAEGWSDDDGWSGTHGRGFLGLPFRRSVE